LIAGAAMPGGVSAAVAEARLVTHENFAGAKWVSVGAARRWVGDPFPGRSVNQLAQHNTIPMAAAETGDSTKHGPREGLSASLRRERCRFRSCW